MRRFTHVLNVLIAVIFLFTIQSILYGQEDPNLVRAQQHASYVEGEILVKYKETVTARIMSNSWQQWGVAVVKDYHDLNLRKCTVSPANMEQAIAGFKSDPAVEYAEPNYIVHVLETVPNDSRFGEQWALRNTGQTGGSSDADIDAGEAWDVQKGSASVLVGIIDTGIDYNHPDLQANIWKNPGESGNGRETNGIDDDGNGFVDDWRGWDFANNDNDPFDDNRHGTHVAGTIGAVTGNGTGVAGINWNVGLIGLKFLTASGSGSTSDAIEAILYAIQMNIPVLNNSWGGGGFSQALADAIDAANQAGILFVAAAGNESKNTDTNANYPSNYTSENIISVASTDHSDVLSSFSNYGIVTVDLAAPGSAILSTVPGNSYQSLSGTSMATPHVAGVAALLRAQYPGIDVVDLKYRILGSVDVKSSLAGKVLTEGRLNANRGISSKPLITVEHYTNTKETTTPYRINSWVTDDGSVSWVRFVYSLSGSASGSDSTDLVPVGLRYSATVPAQALGTTVTYFVRAGDNSGNRSVSRVLSFMVTENIQPPNGGGACCGSNAMTVDTGSGQRDRVLSAALNLLVVFLLPALYVHWRKNRRRR
jgi:subtilisin family serine protease